MKQWLAPLGVFVFGNLCLLAGTLFMPSMDTAQATLAASPEGVAASGWVWGWSWLMTNGFVRWMFYIVVEGFILFGTAKAFLASKA